MRQIHGNTEQMVGLVAGSRTYKNVKRCLFDVLQRGCVYSRFLFTADGFDMYRWLVDRYLVGACVYGQVIKKRKKNRVDGQTQPIVWDPGTTR